ncbi:MAG: RsmB/NOP family class I SAM-dependent RNA methyltransferase [Paracoccaceae bacterium]
MVLSVADRPGPARRRPERERKPPPGLAARRGAVDLIADVLDPGRLLGEGALGGLSPRERAEAHGLAEAVLRRLGEVDAALAPYVERMPGSPACHILRLMAAEIVFVGTASHAAVDVAVSLARLSPQAASMAGLVNAVGRRLSTAPPEPVEKPGRLNAAPWLAERLDAAWGRETTDAILAAHLGAAPHDLTPRDEADVEALAAELDAMALPSGTLRLPGRPQLSALPGFDAGAWWVQDAAAALPARLLAVAEGERVLDLCAAPGGKTLQLAAAGARVTALDHSAKRMARLEENLARTRLTAETVVADAFDWTPEARFDAILLDAPCSATGTIRRHPDLPHRFDPAALERLVDLQARLLARAWGWLAPGGRLVYATCSILPEEGEARVSAFLAATPAAGRVAFDPDDPALPPGAIDAEGALRTLPSMLPEIGGLDGFHATMLHCNKG